MARLPIPGADSGTWGSILNEYLSQSLDANGQIKDNAVTSNTIAPNAVTNAAIANDAVTAANIADGSITNALIADTTVQEAKLSSAVQTKLNQTAPVTSVAGKVGTVTLDKSDVGLSNVDNISDAAKNSATATLTNKTISGSSNTLSNIAITALSATGTPSSSTFLRGDGTWSATPAGGDVSGPAGVTDKAITRFNGTTGKLVQSSNVTIDDTGKIILPATGSTGGLSIGGDTNLYRSAADTLKTDDNLIVGAPGTVAGSATTIDGTQTLTNKTINGSSNTLSNTFTLTTTGTSGATTYNGTTLNIPQYAGGDVVGPGSSVANSIVRFSGTTGKIIQGYTSNAPTVSDTGGVSVMTLNTIGAATIGDGTGNTNLNIRGVGYNGVIASVYDNTASPYNSFYRYRGTIASPTQVTSGSFLGSFGFRGANAAGAINSQDAARFSAVAEEDVTTTSQKTALVFYTAPNNSITTYERLRVGGSGNVTVGYTTDNGSAFSVARVSNYVNGTVTTAGTTTLVGTGTDFTNYFRVGDSITVSGETIRTITAIASDTSLTVNTAFSTSASGLSYTGVTNTNLLRVQRNGNIGINQANPQARLHFAAGTTAVDGIQFGTDTNLYRSGTSTMATDGSLSVGSTLTLPQGGALQLFNTTDQTTNYERVRQYWSGNTAYVVTENGGTGTLRNAYFGVAGTRGLLVSASPATAGRYQLTESTTFTNGVGVQLSESFSTSSGTNVGVNIIGTMTQTGTAGYTMLQVNPTETTTGTGTKLLADFQVGGTSKTRIDNTGSHFLSSGATLTSFNTTDETTNYERVREYWSSNVAYITTENGGTGVARDIVIGTANAARTFRVTGGYSASGFYQYAGGSTSGTSAEHTKMTGIFSSTAGTNVGLDLAFSYSGSGTQGYTALLINPTDTSTGSGAKLLIDAQVGGSSKFSVSNTGVVLVNGASLMTASSTDTLTNKTLTSPKINQINDSNGNTVLDLITIASAVNHVYVTNQSVGNWPTLGVDGSDTNIGFSLAPKGNGAVRISAPSGQTPTLDVAGPDTNIDLNLVTKGTGKLKANSVPVATQVVTPPATASSAGVAGQIAYDSDYFYQCVATNTWKRSPVTSW